MKKRSPQHAFTLVELLIVISIIAILAGILLPVMNRARARANQTKCAANLKQWGTAIAFYAAENEQQIAWNRVFSVSNATPGPYQKFFTGSDAQQKSRRCPSVLQQLDELIAADTGRRVSVGFQMIFSRAVQAVKNGIVNGALGDVREIRIGETPVFDGPASNAMFFASPEAEKFDSPISVQGELYRARPIPSYDVACLRGKFASGTTFTAALTHATQTAFPYELEVIGSAGRAHIYDNGTKLESDVLPASDCSESTEDLIYATYQVFLQSATEGNHCGGTCLRDSRGYVLATNGMLISSGGIHPIGANFKQVYDQGDDRGYNVTGLAESVGTALKTGQLFSEQKLPWAVATEPVALDQHRFTDFSAYA